MYSRDWSCAVHMSAPRQIEPSSTHGNFTGEGLLTESPREEDSTPVRCFTSPRIFEPLAVRGRRESYSFRPSSPRSTASRPCWRYLSRCDAISSINTSLSCSSSTIGQASPNSCQLSLQDCSPGSAEINSPQKRTACE